LGALSPDRAVPGVTAWYAVHARDLPWRSPGRSPWGVLVSEVMLQQTPVDRVVPVWQAWMARWPVPADLAAESAAEVIRAWGRLGYPRRALRLRECAAAIVADEAGRVPDSLAALRRLPGVGDYTAAAVAAFAFGRRVVVLDTNIARVLARAVRGLALPSPGFRDERTPAAAFLPDGPEESVAWNQAVMELGALVCRSTDPACDDCPLGDACVWRGAGCPPPATTPRPQGYEGTDRQARGRVLALLRDHPAGLPRDAILAALPRPPQAGRAIDTLVDDGLAVVADGVVRLPE